MDLPKQAKEQISKLDGSGGAAKVRSIFDRDDKLVSLTH